jgi:hypothetical protein
MQKMLLWGLVIAVALLINVVIAYLSIFVWKLEFYYSLAVAFIFAIALIASNYITRVKTCKPKLVVKDTVIILALCVNYASAYFVSFVWKGSIIYVMFIFFVASIISGILLANITRSLFYACLSLILSVVVFAGLLVLPPSIYGHVGMVNYTTQVAITFASKLILLGIVFCLIGTLIGSLIGDFIR